MRDSPSNHKRRIHRLTKDIYQTTKEFYQLTKEIYRPTKAIHQITKAIHQLTKEVHRLSKEIYLKTKEFYQASKDGTLQMIIDSINTDERYNECAVSPFGLLLAALRVMPSAPSGTTCRSLTLADKPWLLRPFGALAALRDSLQLTFGKSLVCPSGSECHTVTR